MNCISLLSLLLAFLCLFSRVINIISEASLLQAFVLGPIHVTIPGMQGQVMYKIKRPPGQNCLDG